MAGKLQKEINRIRPFDSVQQEAFLNVIRTADYLLRDFEEFFKPYGLSVTQYNVLRILRGAGDAGLPCKKIGQDMIARDPDMTRLLDCLEGRKLLTRQRDTQDRRVVSNRITDEGLRLLKELDQPVLEFHRRQMAHAREEQLTALIDLLEMLRFPEPAAAACSDGQLAE